MAGGVLWYCDCGVPVNLLEQSGRITCSACGRSSWLPAAGPETMPPWEPMPLGSCDEWWASLTDEQKREVCLTTWGWDE